MSSCPAITVLLPVYNAERYLRAALDSIIGQSCSDFVVLAIDDGSTDGSKAILDEYAKRDGRFRIISRPNKGLVATLNEGLSLCETDFVARMDADDLSLPQRFEKQVSFLRAHEDHVAVGSRVLLVDPEGAPIRQIATEQTHEEIDSAHLAGRGGTLAHPASMLRRKAVLGIGGYRQEAFPAEDLDLFLRLAEIGRLANLPEVLLHYRLHPNSIGHAQHKRQKEVTIQVVSEARRRRALPDAPSPLSNGEIDVVSTADHHQKWGWWALQSGYVATARKHALAVVRQRPLTGSSWRLAYCALRGH